MFPDEIVAVKQAIDHCGRPMILSLSLGAQAAKVNIGYFKCADMVRLTGDIWGERDALSSSLDRWNAWEEVDEPGLWLDLDMIPFGALQVHVEQDNNRGNILMSGKGTRRMSRFTPAQKRSFITIRALAASPLIMGGELTMTPDEDFSLITNQHILECCGNGVTGRQIFYQNSLDIRKTPEHSLSGSGWIGIFNRSDASKSLALTPGVLGLETNSRLLDIWNDRELDSLTNKPELTIDPDDVCFIRYST